MYVDGERVMAWVTKIEEVAPIENADKIEAFRTGGWWVVDRKDAYKVGDLAIYVSIDSWVPNTVAPFLSKGKEPREYNGVKGERLRTVKLRGTTSQGLLLPVSVVEGEVSEGQDVTGLLNIQKWERPMSPQLAGLARGNFPDFITKTDQERIQNCWDEAKSHDELFEITMKLDGSSMTVYYRDGEVGVCSRNLDLKLDEDNAENAFVKTATELGLIDSLKMIGRNMAIQGELMGPKIQGNPEGFTEFHFFLFDVFDIDRGVYMRPHDRYEFHQQLIKGMNESQAHRYNHVPIISLGEYLRNFHTLDQMLEYAEGRSINADVREGIVFKSHGSRYSFKVISNQFLLNEE